MISAKKARDRTESVDKQPSWEREIHWRITLGYYNAVLGVGDHGLDTLKEAQTALDKKGYHTCWIDYDYLLVDWSEA